MQEKMTFSRRSSSVSTVLNNSLLWKLLVCRIVDLHINLGIYLCMFIDSKTIMEPCCFLNKQEYFLSKNKQILPGVFVNCVLYLCASSLFLRSYSKRFTADVENSNERLHVIPFVYPEDGFASTKKASMAFKRDYCHGELKGSV